MAMIPGLNLPNQRPSRRLKALCPCGNWFHPNLTSLRKGWGLYCSIKCAAIHRERAKFTAYRKRNHRATDSAQDR